MDKHPIALQAPTKPAIWTRQTLPRVILILGPETALREEAIMAVRAAAFGDQEAGLNWVVLHGPMTANETNAITPASFLDEVCTSSMFAGPDEMKVVIVRQADVFLSDKNYREILERNLNRIPQDATLVLEAITYGKLKTTNFYKALAGKKAIVECESLAGKYGDSSDLEREVAKRARAKGLELSHGALLALLARGTQNLSVLQEELDKLALALRSNMDKQPNATPVSEEAVAEICASTRTYNAFNFTDAILDRDTKRALEVLGAIFDRGIADGDKAGKIVTIEGSIAMLILGALTWKVSQLQDLQAALDAGQSERVVFESAKIFGFRQESIRRSLRKHSGASLRHCMEAIFRANLDLRRGGRQAQEVIEALAWSIAKS
ncbi:MAG: DNA polymerase III subunit delta [Planctomycetota bacterium]